MSKNDITLQAAFKEITRQTGYTFFYNAEVLKDTRKVTINVKDASVNQVLDICFKDQGLTYSIVNKTIVVKKRLPPVQPVTHDQHDVSGIVTDEKGDVYESVSVTVKGTNTGTVTNAGGRFSLSSIPPGAVLVFSGVNIETVEIPVSDKERILVQVVPKVNQLQNVAVTLNTGYQSVPKERATGSFVFIDSALLNRRVSTNILDRLEGVTSGLVFNKNTLPSNEKLGISIRGRSTIDEKVSADPLIVLNNFPYEGDISNINPNDIESITVLKDAAAASIWGARAGNGVIVITTKRAAYGQKMRTDFNANITIGNKPDLWYTKNYLSAADFIQVEQYLFSKGYFDADLSNTASYPVISPVVELLDKQRRGLLSSADVDAQLSALKMIDVRNDFNKYFYRNNVRSQYALNMRGGSANVAYNIALGFDHNKDNLIANNDSRITAASTTTFRITKNLECVAGINYSGNISRNNTSGFGTVTNGSARYTGLFPYTRLADENGTPLAIPKDYRAAYLDSVEKLGFIDWRYRPLSEIDLADNKAAVRNTIFRLTASYRVAQGINIELYGQYENQQSNTAIYRSKETYSTRNSINRYSVRSASGVFTYPFPVGGVLDLYYSELFAYNGRAQANFNRSFGRHALNALAGFEMREVKTVGWTRTSYGYDDNLGTAVTNLNFNTAVPINPAGSLLLPAPAGNVFGTTNRFISCFVNAAYTYSSRYTISASARKDGANIFGVKTNDKITPLWSAGLAWVVHKEKFYRLEWLPLLKIRASYGFNGNVYASSAYLTGQYTTSSLTGLQYAFITSPPNPALTWERVKNINVGIDAALAKDRLSVTLDIFRKQGLDLIQSAPLAPSVGFTTFKGNAAATTAHGLDLSITSLNTTGAVKWTTVLLYSSIKDKVTVFNNNYLTKTLVGNTQTGTPEAAGVFAVVGKPLFGVYSYAWAGLDPATGDPMGYVNGKASKDYNAIINNTPRDSIVFHGSARPVVFGSLRNTIGFKNWSLSFNISYKLKYFFRRSSVSLNYQNVLTSGLHTDYLLRWQKPGDENFTSVPSVVYPANNNRNDFYQYSEALVEKGDNIRFQDISLSYNFSKLPARRWPFSSLQLYGYANNIGLLWTANKKRLDPDYNTLRSFPNPRTLSLGVKATF